MSKQGLTSFEEYAQEIIKDHHIPGVAIGINKDGNRFYDKGFGNRDIENDLEVTPDTVFGIASVTKSFTCVAIMQLQEAGKLSVHDKIIKFLPDFETNDSEKTKQMTIHHFMTHTSGLPPLASLMYANKRSMEKDPSVNDYPGVEFKLEGHDPIDTYEELMAYIASVKFDLLAPPGISFSYSNDAYALLGAIIQRVSGQTYEEYVKENILEPCGMKNSTFDLAELDKDQDITTLYAAKSTVNGPEIYPAPVWWDAPSMRAAGKLKSTINDMLKYTEIFRNNGVVGNAQILSNESVKQMIYPYVEIEPGKYYGYGLMITPDYYGNTLVEHGGSLKAISSLMAIIPEQGIAGMILTNLAGVPASQLLMGALNEVQGKPVDSNHVSYEYRDIPVEQLKRYVGSYSSNEGMHVIFELKEDALICNYQDKEYPVRCIGEDLFVLKVEDRQEVIKFITDPHGQVKRIGFHYRQFPKD